MERAQAEKKKKHETTQFHAIQLSATVIRSSVRDPLPLNRSAVTGSTNMTI